jgi:HEAT repeat protein
MKINNTNELFELALKRIGRRGYWDIVSELHRRGGREIFQQAATWCRSLIRQERQLGADTLGQLGWQKDQYRKQSIKLLIGLLDDNDIHVIASAAYALGHRRSAEAVQKLVSLSPHPKMEVRQGVVSGLLTQTHEDAINALVNLSVDRSKDVRNWATFGLGSMIETDNEKIRTALIQRLTDSFIDVRMEALNGLVSRKHPDAVEWTFAALKETDVITGYLEAAENLANIRLLPELKRIKAQCDSEDTTTAPYFLSCLESAIAACSGKH